MLRHTSAALAAALVLGAPGPALAQSVGDEQYRDPFAGEEQSQSEGTEGTDNAAPAPAPTPAPTTAPAAPPAAAPEEPIATTAGELPRTGAEAAWIAAAGVLLMAGGIGLRRTART